MHRLASRYDVIDAAASADSRSFDFWHETGLGRVEPAGKFAHVGMFRSRVQRLVGEAGAFADVAMTPVTVQRPRSLCWSDGGDEIFLTLEVGSDVVTRIGASEMETTVRPGTIQIMDFREPLAAH